MGERFRIEISDSQTNDTCTISALEYEIHPFIDPIDRVEEIVRRGDREYIPPVIGKYIMIVTVRLAEKEEDAPIQRRRGEGNA